MGDQLPTSVLGIPEQTPPNDTSLDVRERRVAAWVQQLPIANTGECGKQIFQALKSTNRTLVADHDRFKLLELVRPALFQVLDALKKYYLNQSLPLSLKNQRIALLARELSTEFAIGYKIIVEHEMLGVSTRVDKRMLATSMHRAMHYLADVLVCCFQTYEPYPKGVWKQIHRLYLYAEQRNLHAGLIKDHIDAAQAQDSSIRDLYKQIVLLGLAEPYRFRQSVTQKIYDQLETWAHLCDVMPYLKESHEGLTDHIILSPETDLIPSVFASGTDTKDPTHNRVLRTTELTRQLREQILLEASTPVGKSAQSNELPPEVLKRLILAWGGKAKRAFSRAPRAGDIALTVGLSATHYHITNRLVKDEQGRPINFCSEARQILQTGADDISKQGAPEFEPLLDGRAHYKSVPIFGISNMDDPVPDVWSTTFTYQPDIGYSFEPPADTATEADHEEFLPCQFSCTNESAGGFCLLGQLDPANSDQKVQVGELVGLQDQLFGDLYELGIGIIRRLRHTPQGIELGVQKLAPCAAAVATAPIQYANDQGHYVRGLILPEIRAVKQPATLITHALHKAGDRLIVYSNGRRTQVKLRKTLESTGVFSQFEFDVYKNLPIRRERPTTQDKPTGDNDKLDDVWSLL